MRTIFPLLGLVVLAACSVEPPIPLEHEPVFSEKKVTAGDGPRFRYALAPISTSYDRRGDRALFAANAPVTSRTASDDAVYGWDNPPADRKDLQDHFAKLLELSLGVEVARMGAGSIAPTSSSSLEAATCDAAELAGADILVHVDLVENRVTWKSRRLYFWIPDTFLLAVVGIVPVMLVPDEYYEAHVKARMSFVHPRTRTTLFQGEYDGTVEMALNAFQRGLTLSGLVGLHPYFLSPESGDYELPHDGLFPHALRELDHDVARTLAASLSEALSTNAKLLREGTLETSRTHAIVVGHNGPSSTRQLRFAANDAEALGAALLRLGIVPSPDRLRVLADEKATRAALLATIDEVAGRMLSLDRLVVFYSGYGRTTSSGEPVLVLGGGADEIATSELAEHARAKLKDRGRPRTLFLLDASFGVEAAGKNHRISVQGGAAPSSSGFLEPLADLNSNWTVIAAAGPGEAAFEIDARSPESRHGFFTQHLLAALEEGARTPEELAASLVELVPEDVRAAQQADQTPFQRGSQEPMLLGPRR